jgi:hypothetical protein
MFKTFLAVLAAACLVAVVLTSLGLATILGPAGVLLWAVGLVLVALLFVYGRRAVTTFMACLAVGAALSGCAILGAKPAELAPLVDSLANAGCVGDLSFNAGAGSAAGLSPGAFHAENSFKGGCDPRNARPATVLTLKDVKTAIAEALAQQAAAANAPSQKDE